MFVVLKFNEYLQLNHANFFFFQNLILAMLIPTMAFTNSIGSHLKPIIGHLSKDKTSMEMASLLHEPVGVKI